jgi:hypothetical protein
MFFTDKNSSNVKKAKYFFRLSRAIAAVVSTINLGSRSLLGQLDVLHTQNFEVQVSKGTPLVKVFGNFPRNGFHGLKMVSSCSKGTI